MLLKQYTENGSRNASKDSKEGTKLSFYLIKVMMFGGIESAEIVKTVACLQCNEEMQWLNIQVVVIVRAARKRGSAIRSGRMSNLGEVENQHFA